MNLPIDIIDTHQHLWDQSLHRLSWTKSVPPLDRSFVYADYLAAAGELPAAVKLLGTVHVETDPDDADVDAATDWIQSLASTPGSLIKGIVAGSRPEHADFDSRVDRLRATCPNLRGLRRVLHTQSDDFSSDATFRQNVGRVGSLGLTFDLCVLAKQLPAGIELVKACPGTPFVLDHCGVPDVKGQSLDSWRQHIRELATLPNVVACKISGLVAYAYASKDLAEQCRPFVDHVAESFGHDRLIFGSDWPVCLLSCSYAKWVEVALQLTHDWNPGDRLAFFADNARRVYRLDL